MNLSRFILVPLAAVLPLFAVGAAAHADMCALPVAHADAQPLTDSAVPADLPIHLHASVPGYAIPADQPISADHSGSTIQLPASPGSTQLFLSAMMSVGVWQVGRSIKHINVGHLPDWYHADAGQIGHVTPFEFEFCDLPIALFDQPIAPTIFAYRIPRVLVARPDSQFFLLTEAPRGPPSLA